MTVAAAVREAVLNVPDREPIRVADIRASLPEATDYAVEQAFARLAKRGQIKRLKKGVYWKAKQTRFGMVPPNTAEFAFAIAGDRAPGPARAYAAAFLGLTTQIPPVQDFAIVAKPPARKRNVVFHERANWRRRGLQPAEIALLEVARDGCQFCEIPREEVVAHLNALVARGAIRLENVRDASRGETRAVQRFVESLQ